MNVQDTHAGLLNEECDASSLNMTLRIGILQDKPPSSMIAVCRMKWEHGVDVSTFGDPSKSNGSVSIAVRFFWQCLLREGRPGGPCMCPTFVPDMPHPRLQCSCSNQHMITTWPTRYRPNQNQGQQAVTLPKRLEKRSAHTSKRQMRWNLEPHNPSQTHLAQRTGAAKAKTPRPTHNDGCRRFM